MLTMPFNPIFHASPMAPMRCDDGDVRYCTAHRCLYTLQSFGGCPLCFGDALHNVYGACESRLNCGCGPVAQAKLRAFNDDLQARQQNDGDDASEALEALEALEAPVFPIAVTNSVTNGAVDWDELIESGDVSRFERFAARFGLGKAAFTCEYHFFEAVDKAKRHGEATLRFARALPTVGTRSVLFGAHCWFIHPFFVAEAWRRLYGPPRDLRLWAAFFVHDLGYCGCPLMDDAQGERHCEWGAMRMTHWFDGRDETQQGKPCYPLDLTRPEDGAGVWHYYTLGDWGQFCLFHSRFYAKKAEKPVSRLCYADKLAATLEPWWLYLPRVWASGELAEYMAQAQGEEGSKYNDEPEVGPYCRLSELPVNTTRYQQVRHWHRRMTYYLRQWVETHKNGTGDTWTPAVKEADHA